jgi:glycosyltransferase involved in cell wall biosynthesis
MRKKIDIVVCHFWPNKLTALPRTVYEISSILNSSYSITIHTDKNFYLNTETKFRELMIKPHTKLSLGEIGTKSDVIHFFGSLTGAYFLLRSMNYKKASIVLSLYSSKLSLHDISSLKFSDFLRDKRTRFLLNPLAGTFIPDFHLKKVLNRADRIILNSFSQKSFYQRLSGDNIIRIPHGVDTRKFRSIPKEKARERIGLDSSKNIILYAGHSYLIRGIDDVIYAAKLVSKKISNTHLILLLNSMPDSPINFIRNLASNSLGNNVEVITKWTKNIEDYYNAADVIALPYRCSAELPSYPFVLLESMACAKPVVTTRIGAIPEIVSNERNGILINPKSPYELANSIIRISKDDNFAKEIGRNARESVKALDWKIVARKMAKVYENATN